MEIRYPTIVQAQVAMLHLARGKGSLSVAPQRSASA